MVRSLKLLKIPSEKYGYTFYWYDKNYGLNQYSANEINNIAKDKDVHIEIVDSLNELGVYEN